MDAVENLVKDKVVVAQDGLQFMSLNRTSCQQRVARINNCNNYNILHP